MMDTVIELKSPAEIEAGFAVLKQLRTNLSFEDFRQRLEQSRRTSNFQLIGLYDAGQLVSVMGYRILIDFVHGKQVYIDDLVTADHARGKGFGAKLLKYAEKIASDERCDCLRLCTGLDNEKAMKFYAREGWKKRSVAFKKLIQPAPEIP